MTTRNDDLTAQCDGVRDVFQTTFTYVTGSLVLSYNGQVFPRGVNIAEELGGNLFRLAFVPAADTDALGVQYEDPNDETSQIMRASGRPPSF